ncbi:unnamed protein product [marine sediment metagenome]|uniref:Uncharacterized protein n=1 Tax=marine sediment metagenome TaxID=412755 RepID=X1L617_9ZZZZ
MKSIAVSKTGRAKIKIWKPTMLMKNNEGKAPHPMASRKEISSGKPRARAMLFTRGATLARVAPWTTNSTMGEGTRR